MSEVRGHLVGQSKEEIQYMLFHKLNAAPLLSNSAEGQFYYNTVAKTLVIRDNVTWKYTPNIGSTTLDSNVLLIGDGVLIKEIPSPANISFVKVNTSSVASTQQYIGLADLNPLLYTTSISEPGVNTRFATEKAIVDYVTNEINALTFSPAGSNRQIQWNDNGAFGATSKLTYTENLVDVFSSLTTASLNIISTDVGVFAPKIRLYTPLMKAGFSILDDGVYISSEDGTISFQMYHSGTATSGTPLSLVFGGNTDTRTLIQSTITSISSTDITLSGGTASKFLYLDSNKKITYVDIPSGYVSSVTDGIFDLDITAGVLTISPYVNKAEGCFYSERDSGSPSHTVNLLYDGALWATELYDGDLRVMTSHGNQIANGSYHALANSSHNGFLKALPAVNPTTYYLRGDNTWVATSTLNYWQRVGTVLKPVNTTDSVELSVGAAVGVTSASTLIPFWALNSTSTLNSTEIGLLLTRVVSSGTPAAGFGTILKFSASNSIRDTETSGYIINKWTTATDASETSSFEFWLRNGGASIAKKAEITGDGKLILSTLTLSGLSTYADNTAALAGGLTAGMIYKTSSGVVMVTY